MLPHGLNYVDSLNTETRNACLLKVTACSMALESIGLGLGHCRTQSAELAIFVCLMFMYSIVFKD